MYTCLFVLIDLFELKKQKNPPKNPTTCCYAHKMTKKNLHRINQPQTPYTSVLCGRDTVAIRGSNSTYFDLLICL